MDLKVDLKNPSDCTILCNWVFDNLILAEGLFEKALRSLETYISVNINLCGKLLSSWESPTTFDGSFKITAVPFFISDFNLLGCELKNFLF